MKEFVGEQAPHITKEICEETIDIPSSAFASAQESRSMCLFRTLEEKVEWSSLKQWNSVADGRNKPAQRWSF